MQSSMAPSQVVLGGRKVAIRRPRVRRAGAELRIQPGALRSTTRRSSSMPGSVYGRSCSPAWITRTSLWAVARIHPGSRRSVGATTYAESRVIDRSDNVTAGGHPVVVLSHMLWQTVFGSDPQIVGRPIHLNGHPYEVIGVTPPGFRGAVWPTFTSAFWIPAVMARPFLGEHALTDRHGRFQTVGRMRHGISLDNPG